jgi:hypothetical protein
MTVNSSASSCSNGQGNHLSKASSRNRQSPPKPEVSVMTVNSSASSCSNREGSHLSEASSRNRESSKSSCKKSVSSTKSNASLTGTKMHVVKDLLMTPAERAEIMKRSRPESRKSRKYSIQDGYQQTDPNGGHMQAEEPMLDEERIPDETSAHSNDGPPEVKVGQDDATKATYFTFDSGTHVSTVTNYLSVASAPDYQSCAGADIMLTWIFPDGVHERIQHQLETAVTQQNRAKGSRLCRLGAAQNEQKDENGDSVCGQRVPQALQGTYNSIKERFRSEAVEECCRDGEDRPPIASCSKMPSQDELEQYANRAKAALLETIEALEKLRFQCGETLGPAIHRLKTETKANLTKGGSWCRETYARLAHTSEIHHEVAKIMHDCCVGAKRPLLDPPDSDDISMILNWTMPEEQEFSRQADQALLESLRGAASVFLERYNAFVSLFASSGWNKVEAEVALDLPSDFDRNMERFQGEKVDSVERAVEHAQYSEDTQECLEVVILSEVPLERPREPVGAKPSDGYSAEASLPHCGGDDPSSNPELSRREFYRLSGHGPFTSMGHITFAPVINSQASAYGQTGLQAASASGAQICSEYKRDGISSGTTNRNDPPEVSVGYPRVYDDAEAERLERESASVWKKLRKLNRKKRMVAASMLSEFIDEIAHDSIAEASSHDVDDDNASLGTLGTQGTIENPILLLESEDVAEVRQDPPDSINRRQQTCVIPTNPGTFGLLAFDDDSQMSGLTTSTGTAIHTNSVCSATAMAGYREGSYAMAECEAQNRPGFNVGEYRGSPKDEVSRRAEAAEHLLYRLQTHLRDRNNSDTGSSEESTRTYSRADEPIVPGARGTKHYSKKMQLSRRHKSAKQIMADLDEQRIVPTRLDSHLSNVPTGFGVSSVDKPEQHTRTRNKNLLADPNRHALIGKWAFNVPAGILADPNMHATVGGSRWDPTPINMRMSTYERHSRVRVEERDDRQVLARPIYNYESERRQEASHHWLYKDQRCETNRPQLLVGDRRPSRVDVFRSVPGPPKTQDSFSETKSVTSCLSNQTGIPKRSKSVSFNLPDDDDVGVHLFMSEGSMNSISVSSRSVQALAQRSSIARKELARLSQRQAAEMAKGNNVLRIPISAR